MVMSLGMKGVNVRERRHLNVVSHQSAECRPTPICYSVMVTVGGGPLEGEGKTAVP